MGNIRNRQMLMRSTALAGALSVALFATGAAAETAAITFDMPAQPLGESLRDFYRASGEQIVFSENLVAGRTSRALKGDYTPDQALAMLLEGTNLTARRTTTGVVMIEAPQSSSAAGDGADSGTVQALIVTAQKREEDIQDVPIAISAFTQEDLTRSQVAGGPDLVTQIPNFTFTKTNFSGYSIQIRGIGTQAISATTDPAVAVAFNNTPFIRNRFFEQEFYDLQRVEVLRGPQGTLYGRNATGGVVNIISAKPTFHYEAKLSADLGNYGSHRLEGMVNIPLVEDKVALRLAGAWTKRDGYVTNELSGNQTDGRDLWSTRLSLRVAPTDRLNANLIWEHFQEDDDRLRSGKQLCKKDVVTQVGDVPITNYFDTSVSGSQQTLRSGVQATLSQGCKRNSLYDNSSFQRPNGIMLPYYLPLGGIGLPAALSDPYVSVVACPQQSVCNPALIDQTNDQPQDLRVIQSFVAPDYRAKSDLGELQISYDLTDHLTLSSETAYNADFVWSLEDYNRFEAAPGAWGGGSANIPEWIARGVFRTDLGPNLTFCDPQLGCSDKLMAVDIATSKSRQFSQEFRLASNFDGAFNFSLGTNFLRADSMDKYYVFFNSISLIAAGGPPFPRPPYGPYIPGVTDNIDRMPNGYKEGDPNGVYPVQSDVYIDPNPISSLNDLGHNYFLSKNPYKLISYAVFGEAYYQITDSLKLTAGLRWTVDKKEAPKIPSWLLASHSVGYPVAEVIRQRWSKPTGRLTLDWKPDLSFTDETLLYASLAHGYKAGGANPPGYVREFYASGGATAMQNAAEAATTPKTFDPEYVNAFEVGSKNTLDGGRLTLNLAAFYYDYTGYQISEIVDRSAFNRNFDAKIWGAELEADWRPLENLRLGFKGGYEKTRIADGEQAIDLMDRNNGGKPDENGITWLVVRPFPTYASSCILPTYVFENPDGTLGPVGGVGGGSAGGCEIAYGMNLDPVTFRPYVDLTTTSPGPQTVPGLDLNNLSAHPGYPGFNPATAPNGGAGIMKPLGGNELPNAPHFTATVTGDYTLPLPNEWLLTLHSDVHWQSQSWWRVFNDHVYDKLHPYFTMNLAAIFTNEDAGWNIMAYVKNVTDETAITGAFLNSDDTGLTTNVFLTEPRLYGLRVTKQFTGEHWWTGASANHTGPYPLTVEVGGEVERNEAPYVGLRSAFADQLPNGFDLLGGVQHRDLDTGDAREVTLTYQPTASPWFVSAGVRYGKANRNTSRAHADAHGPSVCGLAGQFAFLCNPTDQRLYKYKATFSDVSASDREEHTFADFKVGRDLGVGADMPLKLAAGLRYAQFESTTHAFARSVPNYTYGAGWLEFAFGQPPKYPTTHRLDLMDVHAQREFEGLGPTLSGNLQKTLLGDENTGELKADLSVTGAVLFGRQKVRFEGSDTSTYYVGPSLYGPPQSATATTAALPADRTKSVSAPVVDLSLGLSYDIQRIKLSTGYRWERYFNVIDTGYAEHKSYDRTIDGPYLKIAVGFGG